MNARLPATHTAVKMEAKLLGHFARTEGRRLDPLSDIGIEGWRVGRE